MLARGAISWKSVKLTLTATSTIEAEYIACYEATRQAIRLTNFIAKLGLVESISKPLIIYCDNSTLVCFSQNNRSSKRSKHFDTKYMFVRKTIQEFETHFEHIPTKLMVANPLTKDLADKVFVDHVTHIAIVVTV